MVRSTSLLLLAAVAALLAAMMLAPILTASEMTAVADDSAAVAVGGGSGNDLLAEYPSVQLLLNHFARESESSSCNSPSLLGPGITLLVIGSICSLICMPCIAIGGIISIFFAVITGGAGIVFFVALCPFCFFMLVAAGIGVLLVVVSQVSC